MLCLLFMFVLGACSSGGSGEVTSDKPDTTESTERTNAGTEEQAEEPEPVEVKQFSNEPVTLKVATQWGRKFPEQFCSGYEGAGSPYYIRICGLEWNG